MTIMPHWKICPRCHRRYDWNPDVGVMKCPYCTKKDMERLKILKRIFSKNKKDNKDSFENYYSKKY